MNILVIDIGTTSTRGILYDERGGELCVHTRQTPVAIDPETGYMEQSADTYRKCITEIARAASEQATVDAVSVTAYRSAPCLVDREGGALTGFIMWQDTRNSEICRRLAPHARAIYEKSGAKLNTVFTASKLTWFHEERPEIWDGAYKAMIVPDYVIHLMTGRFVTDHTYGSRTHLMDIRTLAWDDDMCRLFDVSADKLSELIPQGSIAGTITEAFARETGLRAGVPVISAGGDQQCGALGLGVLDGSTIEVNSGTGSFVISLTDAPVLENENVICNVSAIPGMYTQEMNIISSASAVNWLIREFFPEYWGDAPDFDAVNAIAEGTPAGARGLYVVPHFQGCGSRCWDPESRATFSGFSLASRREDMIRALYEGIACEIAKSIDVLPERCRRAEAIAVAGGLSRSSVYDRILSDMTGRRLLKGKNAQATARGAFLSAAVALGLYGSYREAYRAVTEGEAVDVIEPNPDTVALYAAYKERTERLYRA